MGRHVLHDNAAGTDFGSSAYLDVTDNRRGGTDQDTLPDFGVSVSLFLTGTAECHAMQHGDIVLDNGSLADHDTCCVIKHDATANLGGGVNIDTENGAHLVLQIKGQTVAFLAP